MPDKDNPKRKKEFKNPSPIGAQQNPVSNPKEDTGNPVKRELEEREKRERSRRSKNK